MDAGTLEAVYRPETEARVSGSSFKYHGGPFRKRTCNLKIKSSLLCIVELIAPGKSGERRAGAIVSSPANQGEHAELPNRQSATKDIMICRLTTYSFRCLDVPSIDA